MEDTQLIYILDVVLRVFSNPNSKIWRGVCKSHRSLKVRDVVRAAGFPGTKLCEGAVGLGQRLSVQVEEFGCWIAFSVRIFLVWSLGPCNFAIPLFFCFCSFGKILVLVVLLLFDFSFWLRLRQICWI